MDLPVQDLERWFHDTAKNPGSPYGRWFAKSYGKVPSYLRRAATMAAYGAVSSYMTRYRAWQGGDRRFREARPPRWGKIMVWPVLYAAKGDAGAMTRRLEGKVLLKLYDQVSGDWLWREVSLAPDRKAKGRRGTRPAYVPQSPALIVDRGRVWLGQPYEFDKPRLQQKENTDKICAVDLGIHKPATCVVLGQDGTVLARAVYHLGPYNDCLDRAAARIRSAARATMRTGGKLGPGFCRADYARAKGVTLHIGRDLSRRIHRFAASHGARTIVFEDLKGWRPKGGRKGTPLRARFHGWMHCALVGHAEMTGEERGVRVTTVYPRGTSSWAYDGSGKVKRYDGGRDRCRFPSGKEYDADLNAAYNIGARFLVRLLPAGDRNAACTTPGKSWRRQAPLRDGTANAGCAFVPVVTRRTRSAGYPDYSARRLVVGAFIIDDIIGRQLPCPRSMPLPSQR